MFVKFNRASKHNTFLRIGDLVEQTDVFLSAVFLSRSLIKARKAS